MKTKKYWILVIVSFSILIVLLSAQQITGETGLSAKDKKTDSNLTALRKSGLLDKLIRPDKKEFLQGLEGVRVLVEGMQPGVEKYGLTRKALQTDTELQLRQYGIKVLTFEERVSTPGMPELYINVNVLIKEDLPLAAAAISVELRENVLLLREPKRICFGASTWSRGQVARVGLLKIKELKKIVKGYVNEFINDYLAANPKEQSTTEKDKKPKGD